MGRLHGPGSTSGGLQKNDGRLSLKRALEELIRKRCFSFECSAGERDRESMTVLRDDGSVRRRRRRRASFRGSGCVQCENCFGLYEEQQQQATSFIALLPCSMHR